MRIIKFITLYVFALLCAAGVQAKTRVIQPNVKTSTTFAIVIDKQSYERTSRQVEAYRASVESDELGTYIIVIDGETPQQIRQRLIELAGDSRSPLEGVVFVGDIPIPMLRDAQHLTSAFKMDQQRDWKQSSVPSDRYYDDFDLKFDFIRQDEQKPLLYYFRMAPGSATRLQPDIYSARIKPLERDGMDKYEQLASFLEKVVRVRSSANELDNLFVFRGHGYNSNALDAWSGEQTALREQIPSLFANGSRVRFYDYSMLVPAKPALLRLVQEPELDVALFHHHGSPSNQYINKMISMESVGGYADRLKYLLRNAVRGRKDQQQRMERYMNTYGVGDEWFDLSDSTALTDSLLYASMDIYLEDIYSINPAARFAMFDACYNGSFNNDEYIAGAYLFNGGNTVATQGSTVNSIQDKWPNEFIGLLSYGMRIGQWGRQVNYLETHIHGDPTFRFANSREKEYGEDINTAMVLHRNDQNYWRKLLHSYKPELMNISLKMLHEADYADMDPLLWRLYNWSQDGVVRMECLKLLGIRRSPQFLEVLKLAASDNYELVRRKAADLMGECGNDELMPAFVKACLEEELSRRMLFYTSEGVLYFDRPKLIAEFERQMNEHPGFTQQYKKEVLESIQVRIDRSKSRLEAEMAIIKDREQTPKKRLSEIKTFRNYHHHDLVPELTAIAEDGSEAEQIRVAIIEALGWFYHSCERDKILEMCDRILGGDTPDEVKVEAAKTKSRLS